MNTPASDESLPGGSSADTEFAVGDNVIDAVLVDGELRRLSGSSEPSGRRRRLRRPVVLFVVTCITTYCAGCYHWAPVILGMGDVRGILTTNWRDGLLFMACVMGILLLHEMGHFLMTLRHRIPASLPFFIPFPMMITGTMGAVIAMDGRRADRKQLFDIGIAGPLAGLVLAIPVTIFGILYADYVVPPENAQYMEYGDPLFVRLMIPILRDLPEGAVLGANSLLMAGWVGMLVTGLNMMPVSQLDGGHVIHALFGRRSKWIARGFLITVIALMFAFKSTDWILMLVLVMIMGPDHPPTADDSVDIGFGRRVLGFLSLAIPILCFPPVPLMFHGPG